MKFGKTNIKITAIVSINRSILMKLKDSYYKIAYFTPPIIISIQLSKKQSFLLFNKRTANTEFSKNELRSNFEITFAIHTKAFISKKVLVLSKSLI